MAARARRIAGDWSGALVRAAALAIVAWVAVAVVSPEPASASWAGDLFNSTISEFFGLGPGQGGFAQPILTWLIALPEFKTGDEIDKVRESTTAAAFAMLGLGLTASTVRYWLAGLGGSGGGHALQGLVRTVGAAMALVAWPWLFKASLRMCDALTNFILVDTNTFQRVTRIITAALVIAAPTVLVSWFLVIAIVVVVSVQLFVLIVMKMMLVVLLALIYVIVPLLIVFWLFPATDWMLGTAIKAGVTLAFWPILWALTLAVFGALVVELGGVPAVTQTAQNADEAQKQLAPILTPFEAVVVLFMMIKLPMMTSRHAMGAIGGGSSGGMLRYAAGNAMSGAVSRGAASLAGGGGPGLLGRVMGAMGSRSVPAPDLAAATIGAEAAGSPIGGGKEHPSRPGMITRPGDTGPTLGDSVRGARQRQKSARKHGTKARAFATQMEANAAKGTRVGMTDGDGGQNGAKRGPVTAAEVTQAMRHLQDAGYDPGQLTKAMDGANGRPPAPDGIRRASAYAAAHASNKNDAAATRAFMTIGSANEGAFKAGAKAFKEGRDRPNTDGGDKRPDNGSDTPEPPPNRKTI